MNETQILRLATATFLGMGALAASQVGKVAPIIGILGGEFSADLRAVAWLSSTISLLAAIFGLLIGVIVSRIGQTRSLFAGLVLMAIGSLGGSLSSTMSQFILSRAAEGLAFALIATSAPGLLYRVAPASRAALPLWGAVMPIGVMASMLFVPYLEAAIGWRATWQVFSGIFVIALVFSAALVLFLPASLEKRATLSIPLRRLLSPSLLRLGVLFFLYSGTWFLFVTWTPYLMRANGTAMNVPVATAIVVGVNILGNLIGTAFIARGVGVRPLLVTAFIGNLAAAVLLFSTLDNAAGIFAAGTFASLVSGLLPAATMAGLRLQASTQSEVGTGNALFLQTANLGGLLIPPLFGFLYARNPFEGALVVLILSLLGLAIAAHTPHNSKGAFPTGK